MNLNHTYEPSPEHVANVLKHDISTFFDRQKECFVSLSASYPNVSSKSQISQQHAEETILRYIEDVDKIIKEQDRISYCNSYSFFKWRNAREENYSQIHIVLNNTDHRKTAIAIKTEEELDGFIKLLEEKREVFKK